MPNATAIRGAATRAAILERAVDLASSEGLDGLTIGRLAADLEMSKSGLFAHFGSKLELQLATVGAAALRFREAVIDPVSDTPDGAPRLRAMAAAYLAYLDSDIYSGGCFWVETSAEFDDRPGPVRDAIAGALDTWLGELERQARAAGVAEPERLSFELYALVMGANSRYRLSGDRRVFGYARDSVEALLAELPRVSPAAAEERAADFVRRFAEFWTAPAADRLAMLLADDVTLVAPMTPVTRTLAEGERAFAGIFGLVPDLTAEVDAWGATEAGVLINLTLSGTAGGSPISWSAVDRIAIGEDGLATERVSYFDSLPLVLALVRRPRAWPGFLRSRLAGRAKRPGP